MWIRAVEGVWRRAVGVWIRAVVGVWRRAVEGV